jgi:hypothetical protein
MQSVFADEPLSAAPIRALDLGAEREPGDITRPTGIPHGKMTEGIKSNLDGFGAGHGMRPNGSRLSCGRLARRAPCS